MHSGWKAYFWLKFQFFSVRFQSGPTCMYACIIWDSLSWSNLGFFDILVHFCIVRVSVPPHNILEMLMFYFGFQLVKFFFEWNETSLLSCVVCIWILLIKWNLRILDSYNRDTSVQFITIYIISWYAHAIFHIFVTIFQLFKVGCVFLMVIEPECRMKQNGDDHQQEDARHFRKCLVSAWNPSKNELSKKVQNEIGTRKVKTYVYRLYDIGWVFRLYDISYNELFLTM